MQSFRRRYINNITALDMTFILVIVFAILFLLQVVKKNDDSNTKTKAEFVITITWELNNPNDVDSWLQSPLGDLCNFITKRKGLMHLDRDDTGTVGDRITLPTGEIYFYPYNQEKVTIRGIIPGDWTFNLHMYNYRRKEPTKVHVRIEKLNPSVKIVFDKDFTLEEQWEEITVGVFTIGKNGEITHVDQESFESLVSKVEEMESRRHTAAVEIYSGSEGERR